MIRVVVAYDHVPKDAPKDAQDALVQVEAVSDALRSLGFDPIPVAWTTDFSRVIAEIRSVGPRFVFNLVESLEGRGRLIHIAPAILDNMGVSYTGSRTEAVFLTSNKLLAKQYLRAAGVATPAWYVPGEIPPGPLNGNGHVIIKSVWEHASVGLDEHSVGTFHAASELQRGLEERSTARGDEWFAESYVDGREFNLALLEHNGVPEILPPAEITFADYPPGKLRIVGYRAKWDEGSFEYHHTPRRYSFSQSDGALLEELKTIATSCWDLFDLRGYARVDFRVDRFGKPWVLEVNANPCLSPDAGFAAAAAQAGLDLTHVVQRIISHVSHDKTEPDER